MVPVQKILALQGWNTYTQSFRRRCSITGLGKFSNWPTTAVVLSGGEGVRLRPITADLPKGLVRVGGKPLLQWVVEWLKANRVLNIVMGVAYLKEQIMDFFGDGSGFGVKIQYSVHTVPGGTGEGFSLAIQRYVRDQTFFALNGDQIVDLRLEEMLAKPVLKDMNISTGIYVFEHEIVDHLPRIGDVERTVFPKLSKVGKVAAFRHPGSFITINSLRELEDAEKQLKSQTK